MSLPAHGATHPAQPPRLTLPRAIALIALALGLLGFAWRGFGANGLRFGTDLIWRFDILVFFAALVSGPAARMLPLLRPLAGKGTALLQGFCAAMGVLLGFILLPNLFAIPDGFENQGVTAGMTVFILFSGAVTIVLAAALSRRLCDSVGDRACRTMMGVAVIYFWLCFVLLGLARSGQEGGLFDLIGAVLMFVAVIARFGERFLPARAPDPA